MKKFLTFFLFFAAFVMANAQMEITVVPVKADFDSLVLQDFNGLKYSDLKIIKANKKNTWVFKDKNSLHPGVYRLQADTNVVAEILISDDKNQKIKVLLTDSGVVFDNNPENNANLAYHKRMDFFGKQMEQMNKELMELQKSTLPDYMKQNTFNNLRERYQKHEKDKAAYLAELQEQYQGTLLASIVRMNTELPPAPQQCYQNQALMNRFVVEHTFDYYPFDDERLVKCEAASRMIKQYATTLYYSFDESGGVPYLKSLMAKLNTKSRKVYEFFFDNLEKSVGTLTSPFFTEPLYIAMLKDAVQLPDLEHARKVRYERQLSLLDKNLKGSILPNFKIKLSNDSLTDLYSVESEFMLLYFQNPDCPTCTQVREEMAGMTVLNEAIASGKLTVLTVYFEEDEALWRRYLKNKANPDYLHGWDYLHEIETNELFDLRIIPYVFLLDKDKRVIKKDLLHNEIESYIKEYVK